MSEYEESQFKVILLNKPFSGEWLDRKGNIGHEIIDYLSTDNGEHFVYNLPYGTCPTDIWIGDGKKLERNKSEKYVGRYMVLTSNKQNGQYIVQNVIELEEKLHRMKRPRNKKNFLELRRKVDDIVSSLDIRYNGLLLTEVYRDDDTSLNVTFKAKNMYRATETIPLKMKYNFQRNKGYIYNDKNPEDFETIEALIERSIKNGYLKKIKVRKVNPTNIKDINEGDTFLNLIGMEDNEQVFTNMLFSILNHNRLLNDFCVKFNKRKRPFDGESDFDVKKENVVVKGRIDVCAESARQRVIIENKVFSGLNGKKSVDDKTQLSTYYKWGKEMEMEPLCFITAPDYHITDIKTEMGKYDKEMANKYQFVSYKEIANFIEEAKEKKLSSYEYLPLIDNIIRAFRKHSYSKEEFYAKLFLNTTKKKKRIL